MDNSCIFIIKSLVPDSYKNVVSVECSVDLNSDDGQALVDELGENATFLSVDVTQEEQVQGMVAHAVDTYGQLDVIFNNTGYGSLLRLRG